MTEPRTTRQDRRQAEEQRRSPAVRAGLRIAYLHPGSVPSLYANSVHAMRMCDAFTEAGHDVTLYTAPGTYTVPDPHAYYGVRHRFTVTTVRSPDYSPAGYRDRADRVRLLLTRDPPDLIYGHDLYALTAAAEVAPLVYETHRLRDDPNTLRIEEDLLRNTPPTRIVVITRALGQDYRLAYGHLGSLPIVVAPEAAEEPRTPAHRQDPPPLPGRPGAPSIGYVGHLYEGRGIHLVLALANRFPDCDFHLVGGAPEDLDRWRRRGGPPNAYFHGHRPPGAVEAYYPLFDVVLAPYQAKVYTAGSHCETSRWASPMKIFEYMAHGRAIIASDLPVLREVLQDGVNCLLRPPDDQEAWAEAIGRLVTDTTLGRSLGEKARRQFLHSHTWSQRARLVLADLDTFGVGAEQ